MKNLTDPDLIGLFLLINRLQITGQVLGRQSIVALAEIKLPQVVQKYDLLIEKLFDETLIQGDSERFVLCPTGADIVHGIAQKHSLHTAFYNEYYQAILHSQAHHLFCERVYGKDLGQHGMADLEQINALISELEIEKDMLLLDFGCGDGQISEYIADITQTKVTGVDISDQAIRLADHRTYNKRNRTKFYVADLEGKLDEFSNSSFDRIVAIDSLFFAPNPPFVIGRLLHLLKLNGKMGVFYLCAPHIKANETPFAKTLTDLGKTHYAKDFSTQNTAHWRKKKQVLLELESLFKAEGNEFLFKNRLAECESLDSFHRYLYIVTTA
jgi:cyclopropane fatty-acyl-phospholipid synthase-like methyltransferase